MAMAKITPPKNTAPAITNSRNNAVFMSLLLKYFWHSQSGQNQITVIFEVYPAIFLPVYAIILIANKTMKIQVWAIGFT